MKFWRVIAFWLFCSTAFAAEVIPPAPTDFFNDYAHVTSAATANRLNNTLRDYERQTSSQIWVVVYPTMQTDSSLEDYTVRVGRAWQAGLKGKNNGAILFVFIKEHKLRIEVGYGLEGVLPDAICKRILDNEITPRFKQGDFDGGLSAGVSAMIAATKGEYHGSGLTVAENASGRNGNNDALPLIFLGIVVFVIVMAILRMGGGGRSSYGGSGWWLAASVADSLLNSGRSGGGGGWTSGGGGGWSGGGGGGGGGAMGGGGSFGGGGASGSW